MMTGRNNIHVEVVATSTGDITCISDAIHELGLEIASSELMKTRKIQPFNHFHFSHSDNDEAGEMYNLIAYLLKPQLFGGILAYSVPLRVE